MAYQELYVDTSGNAANGGSSAGAPKVDDTALNNVDAVQTSGATHTLENKDNDGWGTTAVGDWVCFDTASGKKLCVVTGIATGGDTDVITVKSLTGTGSIAATGKGVRVGGAWNLPSTAATFLSGIGATNYSGAGLTNGPRLNLKAESFTETASVTFQTNNWSISLPLVIDAYSSSAGDLDSWTGTTRATIALGNNNWLVTINQQYVSIRNVAITCSHASTGNLCYLQALRTQAVNCAVTYSGTSNSVACYYAGDGTKLVRCLATRSANNTGTGINVAGVDTTAIGCVAAGPGQAASRGTGIVVAQGSVLIGCVAYKNSIGISSNSGRACIVGCVAATNVDGISLSSTGTMAAILNCKIGHNSAYGINSSGLSVAQLLTLQDYNEFYSNTTANFGSYLTDGSAHNQAAGSSMFADQSNDDYRPATAAAGNDAGFPGVLAPGGSAWTGYTDMGALGRQHTASGGGLMINPGLSGGLR